MNASQQCSFTAPFISHFVTENIVISLERIPEGVFIDTEPLLFAHHLKKLIEFDGVVYLVLANVTNHPQQFLLCIRKREICLLEIKSKYIHTEMIKKVVLFC